MSGAFSTRDVPQGRAGFSPPVLGIMHSVLIVEDNTLVRAVIYETLIAYGYMATAADGFHAAFDVCRKLEYPIHLILADVSGRSAVGLGRPPLSGESEWGMPAYHLFRYPSLRQPFCIHNHEGGVSMNQPREKFMLRTYSRFPVRTSTIYLGEDFAGQGMVRELSRVGCRILGNYPVTAGETLSVRIAHPMHPDPLFIKQAPVKWVNGLEFAVAFDHLDEREANRLQDLLGDLLGNRSYSDVSVPA